MKSVCAVVILLAVWFSSMYFYLPLPVVVILFAARVSTASMSIWSAWMKRRVDRARTVIKQDAKTGIGAENRQNRVRLCS